MTETKDVQNGLSSIGDEEKELERDAFLLLFEVVACHLPGTHLPPDQHRLRLLLDRLKIHIDESSDQERSYYSLSRYSPHVTKVLQDAPPFEGFDDEPSEITLTPWTLLLHKRWCNDVRHQLITDGLLDKMKSNDKQHNGGKERSRIEALRNSVLLL